MISFDICIKNYFVKLIGNVFLYEEFFVIYMVFWLKNGRRLDIDGSRGKYLDFSIDDLLLIIFNVNKYDVGFYCFIVINVVGLINSINIVLGMIYIF